jgi:RNA polymerase sigma factor (sigma-70 family)
MFANLAYHSFTALTEGHYPPGFDNCLEPLQTQLKRQQNLIEEQETVALLREEILKLPPLQRQIVALSYYLGNKQTNEVAATLGLSVKEVENQHEQAVETLRYQLSNK